MSGDPVCPLGGLCMSLCIDRCARQPVVSRLFEAPPDPRMAGGPVDLRRQSVHARAENEQLRAKVARLESELGEQSVRTAAAVRRACVGLLGQRAELRGDVAALWRQLGDVLSIFDGREMLSAEQQDKLRSARALHALWSETPDQTNGG